MIDNVSDTFTPGNLIQIAGVKDVQEARLLIDLGVKYIGIPLCLDVHEEDVSQEEAKDIIQTFPADVEAVIITYLSDSEDIASLCNKLGAKIIQLHGHVNVEEIKTLKTRIKNIVVIKSLIVNGDNFSDLQASLDLYGPHVDAFITDTFDPETGASGATGKTHDWDISRKIVDATDLPVIIAGGLNHTNVREAILKVRPFGVDSHTGVENKNGRKDVLLVKMFIEESLKGFEILKREDKR